MTHQELPLFPLNTVMFPGATLTLHIFEERYRQMIGQCLEDGTPFGVVLIRDGHEVGSFALPHEMGTLVAINASVRLEDGRLLIATVGQERFRLQEMVQTLPYLTAKVEEVPDDPLPHLHSKAAELRTLYESYWQAVVTATGVTMDVEELPDDILGMSYHLAHRLEVTNTRKQHWLETTVQTRIQEISALLRSEMALLPRSSSATPPQEARPDTQWQVPWSWN